MENVFRCPYCDFDYVHIQGVELSRGREITTIDKDGMKIRTGAASGRGARAVLTLWYEGGHKWKRAFQFHKGQTTVADDILIFGLSTMLRKLHLGPLERLTWGLKSRNSGRFIKTPYEASFPFAYPKSV